MALFVYLVRRGNGPDDRIYVRRTREGFRTEYLDGESRVRYTRTMLGADLQYYLALVLAMATTDILPFHQVQVSAPGYPSVMYALSDLETYAPGWAQFSQVVAQFIQQADPWLIETRVEAPSERSDGTDDGDDAYTVPATPRFEPRSAP